MGVQHLWDLLAPTGENVTLESLCTKKVAVGKLAHSARGHTTSHERRKAFASQAGADVVFGQL